jgi:hypothetical protein
MTEMVKLAKLKGLGHFDVDEAGRGHLDAAILEESLKRILKEILEI